MDKEDFFDLLGKNSIKKAISAIKPLCRGNSSSFKSWISISSTYESLLKQKLNGTITEEAYNSGERKIIARLILLVESIFQPELSWREFLQQKFVLWLWPLVFTFMLLILLWFIFSPVTNAPFEATLRVSSVTFKPFDEWPFSVATNTASINRIVKVNSIYDGVDTSQTNQQYLNIVADSSEFSGLRILPNQQLFLKNDLDGISLQFEEPAFGILYTFKTKALIRNENHEEIKNLKIMPNDRLTWTSNSGGSLKFSPISDSGFIIEKLKISAISFRILEKENGSSILSGNVVVNKASFFDLESNDMLTLEKLNEADLRIEQVKHQFKVVIKGNAEEITSNTNSEKESLKPLRIEYYYYKNKWHFWGVVLVFLIIMLWVLRKVLSPFKR